MAYPEGMTVEVTYSPARKRFVASALMRNGEDEIFAFESPNLSEAIGQLAITIRNWYEEK